jgi:aspartate/methionine/tyrosine aminotransferase
MRIKPFKLERYFSAHEFNVRYTLSSSDCEPLSMAELLDMAGDESMELWDGLKLGYTETRGASCLREEISKLYETVDPDEVMVCSPVEGIFVAVNAILEKGDHVICAFPGYQALYEVARSIGCEVELWTPDEGQGWRFDPAWLEKHIRPDTKLIVVNFPHNPTGYLPGLDDFERIVYAARQRGAYLFSDEMYRHLELEPGRRLPSACDVYDRAVCLFGMSKTFGMAGVRIGWLVTKDAELSERLRTFKDYTTICSSAPSEVLSTIALRSKERIIDRNLEIIRANLKALDEFFEKHEAFFYWNRPPAGTIAFPRLLDGHDADVLCKGALEEAGVLLLPASVFDYGADHVRVGFGRRDLPEAIKAPGDHLARSGA